MLVYQRVITIIMDDLGIPQWLGSLLRNSAGHPLMPRHFGHGALCGWHTQTWTSEHEKTERNGDFLLNYMQNYYIYLYSFIYYILLLEQVYSTTFKYSIHVVRYGSVSCSGFSQPKRWGDDPVAISCNFYRPTSVLIFCTARLIN